MPVGRFRKDPRKLDELERRVHAVQYPEGALVVGMGTGMSIPLLARQFPTVEAVLGFVANPISPAFGAILFGIVAYLIGHEFKQRRIRTLRDRPRDARAPGARGSGSTDADRSE